MFIKQNYYRIVTFSTGAKTVYLLDETRNPADLYGWLNVNSIVESWRTDSRSMFDDTIEKNIWLHTHTGHASNANALHTARAPDTARSFLYTVDEIIES